MSRSYRRVILLILLFSTSLCHTSSASDAKESQNVTRTEEATSSLRTKRTTAGNPALGLAVSAPVTNNAAAALNQDANSGVSRRRRRRSPEPLSFDLSKYVSIGWGPPKRRPPPHVIVKTVNVPVPVPQVEVEQVHHVHYVQAPSTEAPPPQIKATATVTQTQSKFNRINYDYNLSLKLQQGPAVQSIPGLSQAIKVNPGGIDCNDLCTPGNIYALIGICTANYCICQAKPDFSHEQKSCPGNRIFDPVILACNDPEKTAICGDYNHNNNGGYSTSSNANSQAYGVPTNTNTNQQYGVPLSPTTSALYQNQVNQPATLYQNPTPNSLGQPAPLYQNPNPNPNPLGQSTLLYQNPNANANSNLNLNSQYGSPAVGQSTLSFAGFYDPSQFTTANTNTNTFGGLSPSSSYSHATLSSSSNPLLSLSLPSNANSYANSYVQ